jgi:hypothetical protein
MEGRGGSKAIVVPTQKPHPILTKNNSHYHAI